MPVYLLVELRWETGFFYFLLVVWMTLIMANSYVACSSAVVTNYIMGMPLATNFMHKHWGSFPLLEVFYIKGGYMIGTAPYSNEHRKTAISKD